MKKFLLFSIYCYQHAAQSWYALRGTTWPVCPFVPSCSNYSRAAIERHGAARGVMKSVWRVLRCHPWQRGGVDEIEN